MKKRYSFLPKTWLRFSLAVAFTTAFSLNLQAQTAPTKTWDKAFGGNGNDEFSALQQTQDGGYILGGSSRSGVSGNKSQPSMGKYDYWVVKLNAAGNPLWDKTFGGSEDDYFVSFQHKVD
jgi:hypothetical protein